MNDENDKLVNQISELTEIITELEKNIKVYQEEYEQLIASTEELK